MASTVLILGASYGGLTIAHKLLKHTRPTVQDLKVILVNPSTHFYWNLASVRGVVPGQLKDEALFQDIAQGFAYASAAFEFILGTATEVDLENKQVMLSTATGELRQEYDSLVVTTGAKTISVAPWKASGTYDEIRNGLGEVRNRVDKAKSIIIAGGGPTGVELAGELGFEYGDKKEIKLITGGGVVMEGLLPPKILKAAQNELEKLHVEIITNSRVANTTPTSDGLTEIMLEGGQKLTADLFLPTYGLTPNTGFLPKVLLNPKGELILDEFLQVKGTTSVWAAGDVGDSERCGFMITLAQAQHLAKNLDLTLKGKKPLPYKVPSKDMMAVAIGRSRGTGAAGGWKLPSLAVWFAKGRTLGVERMNGLVTGSGL